MRPRDVPGPKAPPIRLTPKQRRKLERLVSSRKAESDLVQRIRIRAWLRTGFALSLTEIRGVLRVEQLRPHHIKLWEGVSFVRFQ